jgi:hypothetical protein
VLLQKRNGAFYLVLWNEALSYDNLTELDIAVADVEVTVTLNSPIETARTFRPLQSVEALATFENPTTLTLMVPDHPLIVELKPPGIVEGPIGGGGSSAMAGGSGGAPPVAGSGGVASLGGSATIVAGQAGTVGGSPGGGVAGSTHPKLAAAESGTEPSGCGCNVRTLSTSREGLSALGLIALLGLRRRRPGD